jgi:ABC-2 type transport system permease protein
MNSTVFWALVRKDLYLLRGFMLATVGAALLAVALLGFGKTGFAVGGILYLTANVASGIFIAMYSLLTERKDRSRAFALSLPISGADHDRAKLVSGYLAYGIPWVVSTCIAVLVFLLGSPDTRGMVVYGLMIQGFVLALFGVILSSLFVVTTEAMSGVVILVTNICFSLFMVWVNQPEVKAPLGTTEIVWTPLALNALAGELLIVVLSIAFVAFVTSRRRDYT